MKVLNVHSGFTRPGGAEKFVLEVSRRLAASSGFEVGVFTTVFNEDFYSFHECINDHILDLTPPSSVSHWCTLPYIAIKLREVIRSHNYETVIFHSLPAPHWSIFLYGLDVRTVWFAHTPNNYLYSSDKNQNKLGSNFDELPRFLSIPVKILQPFFEKIDKHILNKNIDRIVANSEYTSERIEEIYAFKSDVVYPGVDIDKYRPQDVSESKSNFILAVGQFEKRKNLSTIVRAFAKFDLEFSDYTLKLVGSGHRYQDLIKLIAQLDLESSVDIERNVTEDRLVNLYQNAKMVVYLNENEPFGMVPVEAMSCGTPVIGVSGCGMEETIKHGKTGFLISSPTTDEVRRAMIDLISLCEDEINSLGRTAREHVTENFSWESSTTALSEVLRSCPGKN